MTSTLARQAKITAALLFFAVSPLVHAQQAAKHFDVTTVKQSDPAKEHLGLYWRQPDGLKLEGVTLRGMIANAYGLSAAAKYLIEGGPAWMSSQAFDINAKVDAETTARWSRMSQQAVDVERRSMMESLLADRFQLKFHRETRQLPVFVLRVAKGGVRMKSPVEETNLAAGVPKSRINNLVLRAHWEGHFADMRNISLSPAAQPEMDGRPVIDKTGLTGQYDFVLHWTSVDPGPGVKPSDSGEQWPSLFTALEEQLGLTLTPEKQPVDILVVDSAEMPSEN